MNAPVPPRVSVTVSPTFHDIYFGTLTLMRYQKMLLLACAVFPMCGLVLFFLPWFIHRQPGVKEVIQLLLGWLLPFIITFLVVWITRRQNKLSQGTFTFAFDHEGIHTSGAAFVQTLRWPMIHKVRQSKHFLFIFISPTRASCLPLRVFPDRDTLEQVRILAREHTDFR